MELIDCINSRKSIRSYTEQEPTKEQLDAIVYAAQHAPNAGPFATTVITDKDLLAQIDEAVYQKMYNSTGFSKERVSLPGYRPLYHAPALIIFSAAKDGMFAETNTACACTTGSLAATALGLGSCYVLSPRGAYETIENFAELIKIPEGYVPYCGLLIGYTDDPERYINKRGDQEPAVYI